jgi:HK97 gp10 family phage protein
VLALWLSQSAGAGGTVFRYAGLESELMAGRYEHSQSDTAQIVDTPINELRKHIGAFPKEVEAAMMKVAKDTAERIAARARQLVTVATGRTRESIRVVEDLEKHEYRVEVGPTKERPADKDYPANVPLWIEFGTRYVAARPFMRPALDEQRDRYRRDLEAASIAAMQKAMG